MHGRAASGDRFHRSMRTLSAWAISGPEGVRRVACLTRSSARIAKQGTVGREPISFFLGEHRADRPDVRAGGAGEAVFT